MKKLFLPVCTIIFISLLFVSCQNDSEESLEAMDDSFSIEEARSWFETENDPIMIIDTKKLILQSEPSKGFKKPIVLQNRWNHAFMSKGKDVKVIEVALRTQGRFGMSSIQSMEKFKETGNPGYLTSLSRLVIIKNKKSKKKEAFIMTMVGDTDYLERNHFQLWSNTYLKKDKDFSGKVFFHSVEDGSFVNAWRFENGNVTGKITEKTKGATDLAATTICTTTNVYTTYEQCTDWYNVGETDDGTTTYTYTNTTCDTWQEYSGSYTECTTTGNGGYTGGGGGGSQGNTFSKSGLKNTMPIQLPNTCVTSIMEYINKEFCGGNTSEGDYVSDYFQTYGGIVPIDGVDYSNVVNFANRHFNTEDFSPFKESIDNGYVIMTNIPSNIPNSSHNVVVVGYEPGGDFIYMDPQEGKFVSAPMSNFSMNYAITISSCK